jgi:SAM-dependent methyltransferase
MTAVRDGEMRRFWNARAQEDAFYFVDTRQRYRAPDPQRFWAAGELVDVLLEGLDVALEPTDTVLEIGCGIGRVTRALAARAGNVIALDVSDEMLERARQHNRDLERVRWVQGDGVSLAAVADSSIDACISVVVFQHLPEAAIALGYVREVGRVLRPNGWAALQFSNDPAVHRPRATLGLRVKSLFGRAPRGQGHAAWLGSHLELGELREAASGAALDVERVWGEGGQYCQALLRKRPPVG